MNNLTAYKCLECGHYTISRYDGIRCANCDGPVTPVGNATNRDREKKLSLDVNLKDIKIFKRMVDVFSALIDDRHTPEWIKVKIKNLVLDELAKG